MPENKLKIALDCEECIGDGACVEAAPGTFAMDDDDKAFIKDPRGDAREDVLAAAADCPIDIIVVHDEASGDKLYPED